jgi:hypothetical protein
LAACSVSPGLHGCSGYCASAGRCACYLLPSEVDLEPETELCTTVKGIALACPLVAGGGIMGALHVILPDELARYYLYNRVPMTLAHHAAIAFYAADLVDRTPSN